MLRFLLTDESGYQRVGVVTIAQVLDAPVGPPAYTVALVAPTGELLKTVQFTMEEDPEPCSLATVALQALIGGTA